MSANYFIYIQLLSKKGITSSFILLDIHYMETLYDCKTAKLSREEKKTRTITCTTINKKKLGSKTRYCV